MTIRAVQSPGVGPASRAPKRLKVKTSPDLTARSTVWSPLNSGNMNKTTRGENEMSVDPYPIPVHGLYN